MAKTSIITLDLNFQGKAQAIASYLIRYPDGAILIESGPGSTQSALEAGLKANGLSLSDVTHVLLTHIHLDHAGAAGWLAKQGAQIYVHPVGAPHLLHPEKLLASAARIYGDQMSTLWGDFLPVPEAQLHVAHDGEQIVIGNLRFLPVNTPAMQSITSPMSSRTFVSPAMSGACASPVTSTCACPCRPPSCTLANGASPSPACAVRSSPASPPRTSAFTTTRNGS